ncbi:hypothetical protein [Xenorhabdus bovienii]|uniref:hypothetical protein n=1 Tax=Xenorhabdus bovienii TaxID=40576 RepID=UPI00301E43D7|nr:hypothetical protein [Xenorhabdus bovienii]MDE9587108.1 hypothetical protein [Xenorhabdus bovienii]
METTKKFLVVGEMDLVECPKCNGIFPIIEGSKNLKNNGKTIAVEGIQTQIAANALFTFFCAGAVVHTEESLQDRRPMKSFWFYQKIDNGIVNFSNPKYKLTKTARCRPQYIENFYTTNGIDLEKLHWTSRK